MRILIKISLLLICSLVILGVISWMLWFASASAKLNEVYGQIEKAGLPMKIEDAMPAIVPNDQNAAYALNELWSLFDEKEIDKVYEEIQDWTVDHDISDNLYPLGDLQLSELRSYIKKLPLERIFKIFEESLSRSDSNLGIEYHKGPEALVPQVADMVMLSMLVKYITFINAKDNDVVEAIRWISSLSALSRTLEEEPTIIVQLTRLAVQRALIVCVMNLSRFADLSVQNIDDLIKIVRISDDNKFWLNALDMERLSYGEVTFEKLENDPQAFNGVFDESSIKRKISNYFIPFFKPWFMEQKSSYLKNLVEARRLWELPYIESVVLWEEYMKGVVNSSDDIISKIMIPTFGGVKANQCRMQTMFRISELGLLIHRYKILNGSYPENLESFAGKLQCAFSGKEFLYQKSNGGFLLYSIGPNLKNDNGMNDEYDDGARDDVVWRGRGYR